MDCNFPALYATLLHLCAVITVHCVLIEPWSNCKPSSFLVVIIRYVTTWNTYIFNRLRLLWKVRRMCFVNLCIVFLRDGIIVRSLTGSSKCYSVHFVFQRVSVIFLLHKSLLDIFDWWCDGGMWCFSCFITFNFYDLIELCIVRNLSLPEVKYNNFCRLV